MRYGFLLLLMFSGLTLEAQKITLSGKVLDAETNEPLPFASVLIRAKPISTVTNLQGEFDFHFPAEFRNEIFVISMLGYESFESPVWSLVDQQIKVFRMKKSTTVLDEVIVSDSLAGGEIVSIAWNRIEENFPMEPFLLDGFYRDVKKVGGTYISLLEAAVKIYDENYQVTRNKSRLRERVKLVEVRKSLGYENKFTTYFGQKNLLEDLLLHNNIRYRDKNELEAFLGNMVREKDSYYDGHDIFVISHAKDFKLRIFVDKSDYAIVHFEYEIQHSGNDFERRKNLVSRYISNVKTIDFRKFNGKLYLNYIQVTTREKWFEEKTGELKFETELQQNLLINEVNAKPSQTIGTTEKMRNYGLQYQDYPYNKAFWENYNVIKETPLDKKILEDLEKVVPLEEQFRVD